MSLEMRNLIMDTLMFIMCVGVGYYIGRSVGYVKGYMKGEQDEKDKTNKILQQEARKRRGEMCGWSTYRK